MPISAVDLFCGIGGLTHGLQLSGIPVAVGLDVENSCRYAYEHNNNARFVLRDITQVTGNELRDYFTPNTFIRSRAIKANTITPITIRATKILFCNLLLLFTCINLLWGRGNSGSS